MQQDGPIFIPMVNVNLSLYNSCMLYINIWWPCPQVFCRERRYPYCFHVATIWGGSTMSTKKEQKNDSRYLEYVCAYSKQIGILSWSWQTPCVGIIQTCNLPISQLTSLYNNILFIFDYLNGQ